MTQRVPIAGIHFKVDVVRPLDADAYEPIGRVRDVHGRPVSAAIFAMQKRGELHLPRLCALPPDWKVERGWSLEYRHAKVYIPLGAYRVLPEDADEYDGWVDLAEPEDGQLRLAWRCCLTEQSEVVLRAYLDGDCEEIERDAFDWGPPTWLRLPLRCKTLRAIPDDERRARGLVEYEDSYIEFEGTLYEAIGDALALETGKSGSNGV